MDAQEAKLWSEPKAHGTMARLCARDEASAHAAVRRRHSDPHGAADLGLYCTAAGERDLG